MTGTALHITEGYQPGGIGRLVEMHGRYYAREWGFGTFFEAKVAAESAAFFQRFNPQTDRAWFVLDDTAIVGTMIIDGGGPDRARLGAHLRWFILDDAARGHGMGGRLMAQALDFCARRDVHRCYLTTFAGLDAARALYERFGFRLVSEQADNTWGVSVDEQLFERTGCAPNSPLGD